MTELDCVLDELENWDEEQIVKVKDLKRIIERASEQHYVQHGS